MAENSFKAGDVVRLKSGGPKMTISGFGLSFMGEELKDIIRCQWFVKTELKDGEFNVSSVELDDSDD